MKQFSFKKGSLFGISFFLFFMLLLVLIFIHNDYGTDFKNSYFSDVSKATKTVLVFVPHEDDEINVAGTVIKSLTDNGCKVIVVFTNSGDQSFSNIRIPEAIRSCNLLGVKSSNIYFLGYSFYWNGNKYSHIYNAPNYFVMHSTTGFYETNGTREYQDYSTIKYGHSSKYMRKNILRDITNLIIDNRPELIFCVDFDSHPDHRATSLLFEEAIGNILKSSEHYNPIIYKGFAYNTAWTSEPNFYELNLKSTLLPKKYLLDSKYDVGVPYHNWKDRVRFPVPKEALTHSLFPNLIYKCLMQHESQKPSVVVNAQKIISSDKVFWNRLTTSLTYKSKIIVSSGNASYLNDFKLFDCLDLSNRKFVKWGNYLWLPENTDSKKELTIIFPKKKDISLVSLYDNFDLYSNITSGILTFSDGTSISVGPLNSNGDRTDISFPTKKDIKSVSFKIKSFQGKYAGLTEIEVFESKQDFEKTHLIKLYNIENEAFMYRYFVTNERVIHLGVYQYPEKELYLSFLLHNEDKKAKLVGNDLFINKGFKSCKVRIQLRKDANVYDEIELVKLNPLERFSYTILSNLERNYFRLYAKFNK